MYKRQRVNRELGRLFRTYCNTNQNKRPDYLEFSENAINGSYNTTTGYTPLELQSDIQPKRVWSECVKRVATQNLPVPNEIKRLDAKERIKKFAEQRTEKFNSEHKLQSFTVGELILLRALNVGRSIDNTKAKLH